jgi:hypothetical protein
MAQAREVVIIITGTHKALALQKTIEGGVNHMWTLSSLQMHPHAMIVVDEDATLELQVKTVKVNCETLDTRKQIQLTAYSTSSLSSMWRSHRASAKIYLPKKSH